MLKINVLKKGSVMAILTALTLALFSATSAFAAGSTKPPTTAASTQAATQSLEANWKAELARLQFDATILGRVDHLLDRFVSKSKVASIGRERNEKGEKSTTFIDANVLLARAQALISSHAGFDASGKVTDQTQALKSMEQLGALLGQFRADLLYKLRSLLHS